MLVHSYSVSRVNGPGKRFVLWTQGCSKGCKNCYNPNTWKFEGKEMSPERILELIENFEVDGITLTGGDPLEQEDILILLEGLYKLNLPKGIILFSGYTFDEINKCSLRDCFNYIDILIDGKFEESLKITNGLRGSSNQNVISFSNKIFEEEISIDHEIEIGMLEEQIFLTGFPKLDKKYLKQLGVIV